jgi:hypothetical protein
VLYDLYFLPPQFYFISNLVYMVYEKTKMVPPSNFPSKINVQPRHPIGVGVHAWHMSPWHTSAQTWLQLFIIIILMISYIYIYIFFKKNLGWLSPPFWPREWLSHLQGTISDTYSNHRGHIMESIKPQGYILEKKIVFK